MKKVLIIGASGFIGKELIKSLKHDEHEIIAWSRHEHSDPSKKVYWQQVDLTKEETFPKTLKDIETAYYLVHGLKEQEKDFEYIENLQALNFAKWAKAQKIKKIIYIGAIAPEVNLKTSRHLRSRMMTGQILGLSGVPCLEFRASIVLGAGSLSFEMIKALCERLPFRPDFKMLHTLCQPLALSDLLKYLQAAQNLLVKGHQIIELGGSQPLSYGSLLELYNTEEETKRRAVKIPEVETSVFLKLLDYLIPEFSDIGKKLFLSLEYPTVVNDASAQNLFPEIKPISPKAAMKEAMTQSETRYPALWDRHFLKMLLSDRVLTNSGLLSPDLLHTVEKISKLKEMITKKF